MSILYESDYTIEALITEKGFYGKGYTINVTRNQETEEWSIGSEEYQKLRPWLVYGQELSIETNVDLGDNHIYNIMSIEFKTW